MLTNLGRFIRSERILGSGFPVIASFELSQVPMVISLHLQIKDLGISVPGGWNELLVEKLQNSGTNLGQLGLDLGPVLANDGDVIGVATSFLLLLDGGNDPPGGTAGADHVLVGNGEEVPFLDGEFVGRRDGGDDVFHELDHFLVALGLLGEFRHVDVFLAWGRGGHGYGWEMKLRGFFEGLRFERLCFGEMGK